MSLDSSNEKQREAALGEAKLPSTAAHESVVATNQGQEAFKAAKLDTTNAIDGSLRQYQPPGRQMPADWQQQNESIELCDGDVTVSRTKPGNEATFSRKELLAQGFEFPNPIEAYKNNIEHKYKGRELETIKQTIPDKAWDDAYAAFPELQQLGASGAKRLMKAIIANELEHYGKEDLVEDTAVNGGLGHQFAKNTLGFSQASIVGVRDMALQLNLQVERGQRTDSPLKQFDKAGDAHIAKALENPASAPLFVAAHNALDLQMLNRHRNELHVSLVALGYEYNADQVYATLGKEQKLMSRKDAVARRLPNNVALPTELVLKSSVHAANIERWLEKVHQ